MNHTTKNNVKELTGMLIQELPDLLNAGLINGKMGISLIRLRVTMVQGQR